jgi:hypothetical protein
MNKFMEAKIKAEVLCDVYEMIFDEARRRCMRYEIVEENYRQATDWRTGEPKWEDEEKTIPKMEDRYDFVEIPEEEMTEEEQIKRDVYDLILKKIETLL